MASISSLSAPGIEVREYDESLRISNNSGTTVFVPGYAAQGPVEEVITISSISDFETIYGIPTTEAERYFYYTCLAILNNSGPGTTLLTSRLPYGPFDGDTVANAYTLLAYPAIPVIKNGDCKKSYDYFKFESPETENTTPVFEKFFEIQSFKKDTTNSTTTFTPVSHQNDEIVIVSDLLPTIKDNGIVICGIGEGEFVSLNNETEPLNGPTLIWKIGDGEQKESALDICTEFIENNKQILLHLNAQLEYDGVNYGYFTAELKFESNTALSEALESPDTFFKFAVSDLTDSKDIQALQFSHVAAYKLGGGLSEEGATYILGAPATFNVSLTEYYEIIAGEYFNWDSTVDNAKYWSESSADDTDYKFGDNLKDTLSKSAFIAINTSRSTINDMYEGYYFGITDNTFNTPSDEYKMNAVKDVKYHNNTRDTENENNSGFIDTKSTPNSFTTVSRARLEFYLDSSNKGSLSQVLQTGVTAYDTSGDEYDDTVNFGIFKLSKSTNGAELMKLGYSIVEKYNAAFGKTRVYSTGNSASAQNYFIENIIESSRNITIMVNPNIANNIRMDLDNNLTGKIRFLSDKNLEAYSSMEVKFLTAPVSSYIEGANNGLKRVTLAKNNIKNWSDINEKMGVSLSLMKELAEKTVTDDNYVYDRFNCNNALYPFATYTPTKDKNKFIGNTPNKIRRALELVSNDEEYPDVDLLVDAGLSTIYTYSNNSKKLVSENNSSVLVGESAQTYALENTKNNQNENEYKPEHILQGIEDLRTSRSTITIEAQDVIESYMAVHEAFLSLADSFQNGGRGDTFYISDILRGIVLRGANVKVEKLYGTELKNNVYTKSDEVKHSWATSIYNPIKHTIDSFTTSYASAYAQWVKVLDGFTNEKCWVPISGYMAALMCASDQIQGPWYAAAGLNRGTVQGVLDCAINPNQKQRGDLYKICVNSVPKLANIGITSWGIRTLSKKASAFDQNTCRRTFLFIEKAIKKLLRYYIFEPNNSYTQLSIYNEIEPYMESIRNQGGVYSYKIVVDSSNNTPEIVNAGNLAVDVSAAPTRTAEFIVLNMTANKYTNEVSTSEFNG